MQHHAYVHAGSVLHDSNACGCYSIADATQSVLGHVAVVILWLLQATYRRSLSCCARVKSAVSSSTSFGGLPTVMDYVLNAKDEDVVDSNFMHDRWGRGYVVCGCEGSRARCVHVCTAVALIAAEELCRQTAMVSIVSASITAHSTPCAAA
jgi:hypothetical protein